MVVLLFVVLKLLGHGGLLIIFMLINLIKLLKLDLQQVFVVVHSQLLFLDEVVAVLGINKLFFALVELLPHYVDSNA